MRVFKITSGFVTYKCISIPPVGKFTVGSHYSVKLEDGPKGGEIARICDDATKSFIMIREKLEVFFIARFL